MNARARRGMAKASLRRLGHKRTLSTMIASLGRYVASLALCASLSAACAFPRHVSPQTRPDEVVDLMKRVADWQLSHPSTHDPATWTQCASYTGIMALAAITSDARYHDAMLRMGEQNRWKLGTEGSPYLADDHCVGQVYAELYLEHGDSAMIAPMRARIGAIIAESPCSRYSSA